MLREIELCSKKFEKKNVEKVRPCFLKVKGGFGYRQNNFANMGL